MSVTILSCAIIEMRPHPRLKERVNALVRVRLSENPSGGISEHTLDLKLHVVVPPGGDASREQEAVLAKTAKVLKRTISAMEPPTSDEPDDTPD